MHTPLSGLIVPTITPFSHNGERIDFDALSDHVSRQIDAGIHGIAPGGSTGEFAAQTVRERKEVLEAVITTVGGRVPVVAGTGALTLNEAVDLTRHASEVGADAVLVMPPFYDVPRFDELTDYVTAVSDATDLPVMYYHFPARSGVNLSADQIASLAEIPGVQYVKSSSTDAPALTELIMRHQHRIGVFNGWDTLAFAALTSGVAGAILGVLNVVPELGVRLWTSLVVERDLDAGRELWARLWPVCEFLGGFNYTAAVKAGVRLQGGSAGVVRAPFRELTADDNERFARLLRAAAL